MVVAGKYSGLYEYLCGLQVQEWKTTFEEIETIIGFRLPKSARNFPQWWQNQKKAEGRPQCLAWTIAGWKTAEVDMVAETLVFRRVEDVRPGRLVRIEDILPPIDVGPWPEGLVLTRDIAYTD